jgi:Tol biopolymer transport system component
VQTTTTGAANVAVAADGTLVYISGGASAGAVGRSLVWVDRQGQETPLPAPTRAYTYPRLSPDGASLALSIGDQELDLWLWDLARATLTRITSAQGFDAYPLWTPDARQLLFSSERAGKGARNLFAQQADRTGTITRLTQSPTIQYPTSASPDGTRLVFTETAIPPGGDDVMQLRLDGTHEVTPLVQTPFGERDGEVSPDGRCLTARPGGTFARLNRPFGSLSSSYQGYAP